MKIFKITFLAFWVVCTAVLLLGVLTPLDFAHRSIMFFAFFITVNGIFSLSFLLTDFIFLKKKRLVAGVLISVTLILLMEFSPRFGAGWKTQEILFRQKSNPDNIIAFQTEDLGPFGVNRRHVKIVEITPIFTYSTELKEVQPDENWMQVNELVKQ